MIDNINFRLIINFRKSCEKLYTITNNIFYDFDIHSKKDLDIVFYTNIPRLNKYNKYYAANMLKEYIKWIKI